MKDLDSNILHSPKGFQTSVANIGIRDSTEDFVCIVSSEPCSAAGVFTQSRFAGPSVKLSRQNLANGESRAIVVISKNANVANGKLGKQHAEAVVKAVAEQLDLDETDIVLASTGVIGRPYPIETILQHIEKLPSQMREADFQAAARGMMTTDLVSKCISVKVGNASLVGIAKGVGMIEPNMATMLAFFATDAAIEQKLLDALFRRVMDKTFNCLSVDTDTSTSDSAAILANGLAGDVDLGEFEQALYQVSEYLVREMAKDGEGATKLLEVTVDQARDGAQAKRVAKAIVNSPLVKTAVHGADPNWGRVAMAVGKCENEHDIEPEKTRICFAGVEVYPRQLSENELAELEESLQGEEVHIHVSLGIADGCSRVWGCDLSAEYVRINGEYTT